MNYVFSPFQRIYIGAFFWWHCAASVLRFLPTLFCAALTTTNAYSSVSRRDSAKARTRQDTIEERVSRSIQANARERLLATVKVTTQSSAQLLPLSTHSDQLPGTRWKAMNHMEVTMRSRWTSSRRTLDEAVHADA